MTKRSTPKATCVSVAYSSREWSPSVHEANSARKTAERKIYLDFLLFRERGWHLLPHYHMNQPDGSYVVTDWDLCPIKRVIPARPGRICHPLQTISLDNQIPIFPEGTSAEHNLERFEFALTEAKRLKIKSELLYRWLLSERGLLGSYYWARNWKWP